MKILQKGILIALFPVILVPFLHAQPISDTEVEQVFQSALEAFERGNYLDAFAQFRNIYEHERIQKKTTASYLMAGKSLYRLGEYVQAIQLMEEFQERYPNSRYISEASRLIAVTRRDIQYAQANENVIRLGIALPLSTNEIAITRSLFSGIQLAVDAYNQMNEQKIKIIFRDTENTPEGARFAANSLVEEGVSVILGPLFSEQVHAVARVTEEHETVVMAPLATDKSLTDGRRYVFQVNSTLAERGRAIAREAIDYLEIDAIGILEEAGDEVSSEMARGFMEELEANGSRPSFTYQVEKSFDWSRLSELIERDTLLASEGIFFSVYHDDQREASRIVESGVSSLQSVGLTPIILGPSPWLSLNIARLGAEMKVFYVDVEYPNTKIKARRFIHAYRQSNEGDEPDQLAYMGYDITSLILEYLWEGSDLADRLLNAPLYEGVGMRIQFGEQRNNMALYFFEHTPLGPQLVR